MVDVIPEAQINSYREYDVKAFNMVKSKLKNKTWVQEVRDTSSGIPLLHVEFMSPDIETDLAVLADDVHDVGQLVKRLMEGFETAFGDEETTFVVTADHGTLQGRHGWDDPRLTHVPVLAYGRGIMDPKKWPQEGPLLCEGAPCREAMARLNLDLQGVSTLRLVDVAPLVSALLGSPIPPNSRGEIPNPNPNPNPNLNWRRDPFRYAQYYRER